MLQPHHPCKEFLQLFSAALGFCYSEESVPNFIICPLLLFTTNRDSQQLRPLSHSTDVNSPLGKLALHLSVFTSHLSANYLPIRDPHEISRNPESIIGPLAGQGPATHGVSLKRPIFPSALSAPLAGLNTTPQEGSQVWQQGRERSCTPATAQALVFSTDRCCVTAAARSQGG